MSPANPLASSSNWSLSHPCGCMEPSTSGWYTGWTTRTCVSFHVDPSANDRGLHGEILSFCMICCFGISCACPMARVVQKRTVVRMRIIVCCCSSQAFSVDGVEVEGYRTVACKRISPRDRKKSRALPMAPDKTTSSEAQIHVTSFLFSRGKSHTR